VIALPAAPAPARPRSLLVGAAFGCAAMTMMFGSMLAVYIAGRDAAGATTKLWLPKGAVVPGIAANVMFAGMVFIQVMVQWARWSVVRDDRQHAFIACGVVALFAVGVLNAQVFIWQQMKVPVAGGAYHSIFYAITGTFFAALIVGLLVLLVSSFRALGGRTGMRHGESMTLVALYWHFLGAAFAAIWLVVYVVK
jgi:heme/copper-type cytochrome/quinol oxidase subunit 3